MYCLLKKLVGHQYLEFLRLLVPSEILVTIAVSAQLEWTAYVQLNNSPDPIHKEDIDINDPVALVFQKNLDKANICVGS